MARDAVSFDVSVTDLKDCEKHLVDIFKRSKDTSHDELRALVASLLSWIVDTSHTLEITGFETSSKVENSPAISTVAFQ